MNFKMRHALLFVLLAAAMTLAGCFGGGGGSSSGDGGKRVQLSGSITPSAKISQNLIRFSVKAYENIYPHTGLLKFITE